MNKTLPVFKIFAIVCLTIVSIVEITVLTGYAKAYTNAAKLWDAEYMSVFFYIAGFSFIGVTVSAVFSVWKKNFVVIGAAVEFLVVLSIFCYVRKNYSDLLINDETANLFLRIAYYYGKSYVATIMISVVALVLGILDMTLGDIFSYESPNTECIYCGRHLYPGERCTCDLADSFITTEFETDPENYADDVEKRQCPFCGRLLYGTEICNCPNAKRLAEEEEILKRGRAGMDGRSYTTLPEKLSDKRETSSRHGFINAKGSLSAPSPLSTPRPASPSTPPAKKPGDSRFFNRPDDL